MKVNELMIGDWVDLSDVGKEIIPCKVVEIHTDELLIIQPNDKACDIVGYDMVRPIPLTAEILEKNGWEGIDEYRKYGIAADHFNQNYNCEIGLKKGGCFLTYNGWEYSICEIKGVHELQRVLRCCGLWDLAENFEV